MSVRYFGHDRRAVTGPDPDVAVIEPCPPNLRHVERPVYGGSLVHNDTTDVWACTAPECGWRGAPVIIGGFIQTRCPSCGRDPDPVFGAQRVARNAVCPCGSGLKAKRCGCSQFYV